MSTPTNMNSPYPLPPKVHPIPSHLLDLRPASEIDTLLLNPPHPSQFPNTEKNLWFYWHTGYSTLPPHHRRTIHAYFRRLSPLGWTIRVVDRVPNSPLNISNYLDITDPNLFPLAFANGTLTGTHAIQHSSDLVRFPLLLTYGGVYADVGLMQIGDLDRLWTQTVGNPTSPYEIIAYDGGETTHRTLCNYFFASQKNNPFFSRCHQLLLKLWQGKQSTEGMHSHPLLASVPLMGQTLTLKEGDKVFSSQECAALLTDYIIQGQVMTLVLGLIDTETNWDGPTYAKEKIYTLEFMLGAQLINQYTAWNGPKAFQLMSMSLPKEGEEETEDQRLAKETVENCLSRSFGFKLATGIILRFYGDTLGSLWKKYPGSDCVEGTYAGWLRYGMVWWGQDELPRCVGFEKEFEGLKRGQLLREC
ncbi:hypothetical protein QBC38DRAFT_485770 [Podospora fimiseda]|uniref:Capsule polysaccharide biosynthesis protein n=1 Tax=Podospora fimiseda TaxID=252190 RepID=A0AAN7BJ99_9PEZI|nr:hypothetical protein QBC38DRAFT_485770 [Podospora fimiseda]